MIALGSQRSRGGLGQVGIGLQGFVKYLHLPPFFVGRGDGVIVASQITANQMQYPGAVVFFMCSELISGHLFGIGLHCKQVFQIVDGSLRLRMLHQ